MAAFFRAQTIFPRLTGDPADAQSNTTYWETDGDPTVAAAALVVTELTDFYHACDAFMPDFLFSSTAEVKIYSMVDPEPRLPVLEDTISLVLATGAATIPPEISMVLSFHGEFESGVNRARRRGRIYLPTFLALSESATTSNVGFPTNQISAVVAAATAMLNNGVAGLNWAVFSPTTFAETGDLPTSFNDVVGGWVDAEPDIQRRRGGAGRRGQTLWP